MINIYLLHHDLTRKNIIVIIYIYICYPKSSDLFVSCLSKMGGSLILEIRVNCDKNFSKLANRDKMSIELVYSWYLLKNIIVFFIFLK